MQRIVVLCLLSIPLYVAAQRRDYPQGYFRNPLDIPILLAGNFGECRPGHFHSGLDIKTGGRENEPVYAAADGYVSRIKMEPSGFGHGLYITHPNGYTTLYAHLNNFMPAIQTYVRQRQYAQERWTVDLQFGPERFPVKKGELIAWSGNTGGSMAPHLHFEIRNTATEHPLNPQLFGFDVADARAPVPKQLAVYIRDNKSHITNTRLFSVTKGEDSFIPNNKRLLIEDISQNDELIGFGIVADDFMDGSNSTLAFYTAEWYADDSLLGRIRLDNIGYDETRYLHAYADYGFKQKEGIWIQRLYKIPGNKLDRIYENLRPQEWLTALLKDRKWHSFRITLTDANDNNSLIRFSLATHPNAKTTDSGASFTQKIRPVGEAINIAYDNISFHLDDSALYEDTRFDVYTMRDSNGISHRFHVGDPTIPVHHYFDLRLKPNKLIPFSMRSKIALVYSDGKEETGRAATTEAQGWYKATVRALGEYRLTIDTTAPTIKLTAPVKGNFNKAQSIVFRATDNLTSVKTFRGELDGKWILFEQHENLWTYIFDEHCGKGPHKLLIKAIDENGNEGKASYTFVR